MRKVLIPVESYDDAVSLKDKISWYPNQRIILVWPKDGRILNSELDLALIARAAKGQNADLVLVTHHPVIREWAEALCISVYPSITTAENGNLLRQGGHVLKIRKSRGFSAVIEDKQKIPSNSSIFAAGKTLRIVPILLSILALLALCVTILPSARITYYPKISVQEIEIDLRASEVISGITLSGNIPARFKSVEVNGELSKESSGETFIPSTKSTGEVTFTNLTDFPVEVPQGTILTTGVPDGTQFILLDSVKIPSGTSGIASGRVEAITPGSAGNVKIGEITVIAGDLSDMLEVNNLQALSGGSDVETTSPDEDDYQKLKNDLINQLKTDAIAQLHAQESQNIQIIDESLLIDSVISEEQVNPVGQPSDTATIRLDLSMKVLTYMENDLKTIALMGLNSDLQKDFIPLDDEITLEQIGGMRVDELGQAYWTVRASRVIIPKWNPDQAANQMAGKRVEDAADYLSSVMQQTEPAKIQLLTSWWPWMPFLPTQIHFVNGMSL